MKNINVFIPFFWRHSSKESKAKVEMFYFQIELRYAIGRLHHGSRKLTNKKKRTDDKNEHNFYSRKLFSQNNNKNDWYVDFLG